MTSPATPVIIDFRPRTPATPSQMRYIAKLTGKCYLDKCGTRRWNAWVGNGPISKREASRVIDWLKEQPLSVREAADDLTGDRCSLHIDGIYRVPSSGAVYKVQRAVHGSNRFYAKKMIHRPDGSIAWDYKIAVYERAITWLQHKWRLNAGQAKRLGVLYGTCMRCGRTLTKEQSIERSSGDTCAAYIADGDWGTYDNR